MEDLRRSGKPSVMVTLARCKGSTPREVGAKMIVYPDGTFSGTIGGGALENKIIQDARECFETRQSTSAQYPLCTSIGQCCGGVVDVVMEVINMEPIVHVFGAGHVGQALCRILLGTPFQVHAVDARANWLAQLPAEVQRDAKDWQTTVEMVRWDEARHYAVVMTHSHELDQEIIDALMERPLRYLGLIGSRNKWLDFQLHLSKSGKDKSLFSRVHCPIGIGIGGKSPQEVAISIAAELLKVHYGR